MSAVEDVVDRLRVTPLSGPRDKTSAEVREWAAAVGREGSDDEILRAFNQAADIEASTLRADLARVAASPETRPPLIDLLSRTGTTDAVRLAILAALDKTLDESDITRLARVSVRQRPVVLAPTLELLGGLPTAEALFALAKVFAARDDEHGARARELATEMRRAVPAAVALDSQEAELPDADADLALAYAAAASDPEPLAKLRDDAMTPLKLQLEEELALLDAQLQARAREQSSTNEHDARLRDKLYEAMALTGLPVDDSQQARALENLFRRTDLADVNEIAPFLPAQTLALYVTRSLTRANRRGTRSDRAVFAVGLLAEAAGELWEAAKAAIVECLDEDAADLRLEAARVLARHTEELDPPLRRRLAVLFAELDAATQERVVADFATVLATEAHEVDLGTFIRWVAGASGEELVTRVHELLLRLVPRQTQPQDATSIATSYSRARSELDREAREFADEAAGKAFARWIHGQGGRTIEASRALLSVQDIPELLAGRLREAFDILRRDQARMLVAQLLEHLAPRHEGLLAVAGADVDSESFERIILTPIAEALAMDIDAAGRAFAGGGTMAGPRLVAGALAALGNARRRAADLEGSSEDEDVAALSSQLEHVLRAVEFAERDAAGNDELLRHFAAIRQAVGGLHDAASADDVPEAVRLWRLEAGARLATIAEAGADGKEPLRLRGDLGAHAPDVLRLLAELDQRAHSPRVVSADERHHHLRDLARCAGDAAAGGLFDDPDPLDAPTGKTSLAQVISSAWARRHADVAPAELRSALGAGVEPRTEQRAVLRIDALSPYVSGSDAVAATADLESAQIEAAWRRIRPALVGRLRELATLEGQARSRSATAMERIADGLAPSLRAIESVMASYFRMRRLLAAAGWKQVEDTLGRAYAVDSLDPSAHQVVGAAEAEQYLVRTLGIQVRGQVADKAIVEALTDEEQT